VNCSSTALFFRPTETGQGSILGNLNGLIEEENPMIDTL
jgi:hypothetical protein